MWVVTGGNSGLGLALVSRLLAAGAAVVAADRQTHSLQALAAVRGEKGEKEADQPGSLRIVQESTDYE